MGTRMRGIRHSSSVCSAWLEFGWAPSFLFCQSFFYFILFLFLLFSRDLAGGFVIAVILSGLCRDQVLGIPEVPSWLPQALLLSEGVPIGPAGRRHARAGGGGGGGGGEGPSTLPRDGCGWVGTWYRYMYLVPGVTAA